MRLASEQGWQLVILTGGKTDLGSLASLAGKSFAKPVLKEWKFALRSKLEVGPSPPHPFHFSPLTSSPLTSSSPLLLIPPLTSSLLTSPPLTS